MQASDPGPAAARSAEPATADHTQQQHGALPPVPWQQLYTESGELWNGGPLEWGSSTKRVGLFIEPAEVENRTKVHRGEEPHVCMCLIPPCCHDTGHQVVPLLSESAPFCHLRDRPHHKGEAGRSGPCIVQQVVL